MNTAVSKEDTTCPPRQMSWRTSTKLVFVFVCGDSSTVTGQNDQNNTFFKASLNLQSALQL